MAYQALYRLWRPRDFSHVVGQEAIIGTLRNQVTTGRISHAYLFCGSRGTGKTSTAKILARAINCQSPDNGDPCGQCEMCRRMESEESLDIVEFDAASNSRVENARDVIETVKYQPQYGKYKVYIIDEVHMMSTSAFNALLKTIEEPPEHVVFILATTEPQKLPATILSRCQRFDFGRIPAGKIAGRLAEAVRGAEAEASNGALMLISRAAEGGMRDALSILDMCLSYRSKVDEKLVHDVLGTSDRGFLFRFGAALADENAAECLRLIDELMRDGKDPLVFTKDFSQHLRSLLMAQCCGNEITDILEITEEDAAEYVGESNRFTPSRLMEILDLYMKLETELRYSGSPRIALENVTLKSCLRTEAVDTLVLNDRICELENRIANLQKDIGDGKITVKATPATSEPAAASPVPPKQASAPTPHQTAVTPMGRGTDEIWREAIKSLQRSDPGVEGMLKTGGRFVGSEDGQLFRWEANPGSEYYAQALNMEKTKIKIEKALTDAAGTHCTFSALDIKAATERQRNKADDSYVGSLQNIFGNGAVEVTD